MKWKALKSMSWITPIDLDIVQSWDLLPEEILELILAHLDLSELFRAARVCKRIREVLSSGRFKQVRARLRPIECTLGPTVFCVEKDLWQLWGFDWKDFCWRKLPPFTNSIPAPDPELFKDFLVAGHRGLLCANLGKASNSEKLYVLNPLSGNVQQLPPLNYPRHPVVLSLYVTTSGKANYRVIAAGSAAAGNGHLSRKTELFCSVKGRWEVAGDVPGDEFGLNDYQTGVYCEKENLLMCTGFTADGSKGILAFDVGTRKWREHWNCPFFRRLPQVTIHFTIAQLVECSGVVYLFSEQEILNTVTHCIDRLDLGIEETYTWTQRLTMSRRGCRALLVYPEFTCVPVGEHKLCIFNTVHRTGDVYDMNQETVETVDHCLPTPPALGNKSLMYSLNPSSYSFQPSFGAILPE